MKGANSRFSHRPAARYSNLAQVQGGMVTDADLNEAGQIHQSRDEAQGRVTVRSGVPVRDGMVGFGAGGLPRLQEGWVVADGKQGRFALAPGAGASISQRFAAQADLPAGPSLGATPALLYADLWERGVGATEDPYLADPGLHGAETSYRTRTMVQVKALPLSGGMTLAAALQRLESGEFPFLHKGAATAAIAPRATEIATDPCDPCASLIEIDQTLPNALFRLEVIAVARNAAGSPTGLTLAWSLENAEAVERAAALSDITTRDAFARGGAVYEFLNPATEAQIGTFADGFAARRPVFSEELATVPAGTPAFTHARRWDGVATATLGGAVGNAMGTGTLSVTGAELRLSHEYFTLTLDLAGRQVLAGDHWLVELRRYAAETERLRLVGADAAGANAPPVGVEHHFCPLFATEGDAAQLPDDATRRRLSMPTLSDLPASHVAYDPACTDWYGPVKTVQGALDSLCHLGADRISYDPAEGCERFEGTRTVAEALDRLCKVEDNATLRLVLRTMMDWGVVCGLRLGFTAREPSVVTWTAGVALDRTGRIVTIPAGRVDFAAETVEGADRVPEIMEKFGEVCFALSFDDAGWVRPHLLAPDAAMGPPDPTVTEAIRACVAGRKRLKDAGAIRDLQAADMAVLQKVGTAWARHATMAGALPLTAEESRSFDRIADRMLRDLEETAGPEEAARVKELWVLAEREFDPAGLGGAAANAQRMNRAVAKVAAVEEADVAASMVCLCLHALTACPPKAEDPAPVPLGCLTFATVTGRQVRLRQVCNYCCRRQAMTWRAVRYYEQDSFYDQLFGTLKRHCCPPPAPERGGIRDLLDVWAGRPPLKLAEEPPTALDFVWPPRRELAFDPTRIRPEEVRPEVARFGARDAEDILTGNGLEVVQVIDLNRDPEGFARALESARAAALRPDAEAAVGRKVVLLTRGNEALDYVTVGEGTGRFQFQTRSEVQAIEERIVKAVDEAVKQRPASKLEGGGIDTGGIGADLDRLAGRKEALEREVAALGATREALAGGVADLAREIAALDGQRATALSGVAQAQRDLQTLQSAQGQAARSIAETREALSELQKAQEGALREVRGAQPIESLNLDARALERLKAANVVTVKDLQGADTRVVERALAGTGVNAAQLRTQVDGFINRR